MSNFYNQYKSTINVVVGVGAVLVGYTVYQNYRKKEEEKKAQAGADAAQSELALLANQGINPSYYDSQYLIFADQIVQATSGCGTDEEKVYNVFRQMQNDADIRKLVILFGVQYYQPCAWTSPIAYSIWSVNDQAYGGSLSTFLGYDLGASEIAAINSILATKGINFQF